MCICLHQCIFIALNKVTRNNANKHTIPFYEIWIGRLTALDNFFQVICLIKDSYNAIPNLFAVICLNGDFDFWGNRTKLKTSKYSKLITG